MKWLILNACLIFCFLSRTNSLNILVVKVAGTKSVDGFFRSIIDVLLEENHKVFYVTGYESSPHPNLTLAVVDDHMEEFLGKDFNISMTQLMTNMLFKTPHFCNDDMDQPQTERILQNKFDLVLISMYFANCYLSVVHQQNLPFIYINPNVMVEPVSHIVGHLSMPSVIPNKATTFHYPLSFMGRLSGGLLDLVSAGLYILSTIKLDKVCREKELCPPEMPSILDMEGDASLTFANEVTALEEPVKSFPPSIINIGGIQIKPTKPLPKHLQEWMDGSGDAGVIYFSLGSVVKTSRLDKKHKELMVKVFSSLGHRIIWKWNEDHIDGLSSNVLLSKWLPQQDILAHSKTRLFITHGGLYSTQEATYFGVPVVGMPVFGDQNNNIAEVVYQGWGLSLKWTNLTEESFRETILKALTDKKLLEICEKRSLLMRDQPMTPSELVKYWTNYVMRHDGAHHLRSPFTGMPWYKIYNFDVWLLVFVSILTLVFVTYKLIKYVLMLLLGLFVEKKKRKKE